MHEIHPKSSPNYAFAEAQVRGARGVTVSRDFSTEATPPHRLASAFSGQSAELAAVEPARADLSTRPLPVTNSSCWSAGTPVSASRMAFRV